jgi:hypothetical protein
MVRLIGAPTVSKGGERIRVCLHAGNTMAEGNSLAEAVAGWLVVWKTGAVGRNSIDRGYRVEGATLRGVESSAPYYSENLG